jgi:hypothetical protein
MRFLCFRFFLFFLGVAEGFEYLVAVGGSVGRVAQYGLTSHSCVATSKVGVVRCKVGVTDRAPAS